VWSKALKVRAVRSALPLWRAADWRGVSALRLDAGFREGASSGLKIRRARAPETATRLHERRKALEGEPQERIRHEIRPAGSGRIKAS